MQLGIGVAFWILPRFATGHRYGRESLGWIGYVMFNTGLIAFILSAWIDAPELPFIGRGLELGGVVCFAVMLWPRVKAFAVPTA